ncbi:DUF1573 domain-containing protein [Stieleria mannarensis]|uniref:DUF1573 domain-containing protein n=1 Tax=Stieleria mannarensis TaxID=2755585 RepID=UPI00256FE785|nr:DUF1573 domain-containing protein [Rhodopirellula sp. JC639]
MIDSFPTLVSRRIFLPLVLASLVACFAVNGDPATAQSSAASSSSGENWAEKMFKTTSHDFRTVGRGTKCEYRFDFTNLYQEDVHVAAVRSSCGCTTPTVTRNTLKTHETASVVARFNTSTFIGQKSAVVTVVIDRPYYAEVQLKVSGFIRTDVTFDPPEVAFGEIASGSGTTQDIVITHTGNRDWQITDVRSFCDDLEVQLSAPQKSPGMVRYRMRVNILGTMPEGDVHERLTLISNDADFPTTEMSINGRIRPSLSVSPSAVSFGTADPGATVEKRLVVRGDEPFAIKEILCADERFEFVAPSGSKKLHFVTLRFNAGADEDRVGQEIQINTDLNGGKSVKCIVTGVVRS